MTIKYSNDNLNDMEQRPAKAALYDAFASVAAALGNGRRAEIVDLLAQGEHSVEQVASELGLSVAGTSHHLRLLARSGLARSRREGNHVYYRLASERVGELWAAIRDVAGHHVAEVTVLADEYLGERDVELLSAAELEDRLQQGKVVLLDVRPETEYRAGHIAGAVSAPLARLDSIASDLPRRREIVAYCRGPYCVLSYEAVAALRAKGFKVRRLEDGLPEWRAAGFPVAEGSA